MQTGETTKRQTRLEGGSKLALKAGYEPIPGYRLVEPLGAGGFGEVWKVEAPGGLQKAAKFVRGLTSSQGETHPNVDRELKGLSRLKDVRHPYILSLERFDIVNGQLIIIMELADDDLQDRLRARHEEGFVGIPRDELLRYMQESAEALDLVNTEFAIQHLDIKPANLFLVRGHVKVADFGLAKMFEGERAKMSGGITPIYAAPESFDGWVSRNTDQYSLAIVYQEMLTGCRPFLGPSPLQLMFQHATAEPDLSSLPDCDRAIIRRALEKDPEKRFGSCAELVQELMTAAPTAGWVPQATVHLTASPSVPTPAATVGSGSLRSKPRTVTPQTYGSRGDSSLSPTEDQEIRDLVRPTLVIGVGPAGSRVADAFEKHMHARSAGTIGTGSPAGLQILLKEGLESAECDDDSLLLPFRTLSYYHQNWDGLQTKLGVDKAWLPPESTAIEAARRRLAWLTGKEHHSLLEGAIFDRLDRLRLWCEQSGGVSPHIVLSIDSTCGGCDALTEQILVLMQQALQHHGMQTATISVAAIVAPESLTPSTEMNVRFGGQAAFGRELARLAARNQANPAMALFDRLIAIQKAKDDVWFTTLSQLCLDAACPGADVIESIPDPMDTITLLSASTVEFPREQLVRVVGQRIGQALLSHWQRTLSPPEVERLKSVCTKWWQESGITSDVLVDRFRRVGAGLIGSIVEEHLKEFQIRWSRINVDELGDDMARWQSELGLVFEDTRPPGAPESPWSRKLRELRGDVQKKSCQILDDMLSKAAGTPGPRLAHVQNCVDFVRVQLTEAKQRLNERAQGSEQKHTQSVQELLAVLKKIRSVNDAPKESKKFLWFSSSKEKDTLPETRLADNKEFLAAWAKRIQCWLDGAIYRQVNDLLQKLLDYWNQHGNELARLRSELEKLLARLGEASSAKHLFTANQVLLFPDESKGFDELVDKESRRLKGQAILSVDRDVGSILAAKAGNVWSALVGRSLAAGQLGTNVEGRLMKGVETVVKRLLPSQTTLDLIFSMHDRDVVAMGELFRSAQQKADVSVAADAPATEAVQSLITVPPSDQSTKLANWIQEVVPDSPSLRMTTRAGIRFYHFRTWKCQDNALAFLGTSQVEGQAKTLSTNPMLTLESN